MALSSPLSKSHRIGTQRNAAANFYHHLAGVGVEFDHLYQSHEALLREVARLRGQRVDDISDYPTKPFERMTSIASARPPAGLRAPGALQQPFPSEVPQGWLDALHAILGARSGAAFAPNSNGSSGWFPTIGPREVSTGSRDLSQTAAGAALPRRRLSARNVANHNSEEAASWTADHDYVNTLPEPMPSSRTVAIGTEACGLLTRTPAVSEAHSVAEEEPVGPTEPPNVAMDTVSKEAVLWKIVAATAKAKADSDPESKDKERRPSGEDTDDGEAFSSAEVFSSGQQVYDSAMTTTTKTEECSQVEVDALNGDMGFGLARMISPGLESVTGRGHGDDSRCQVQLFPLWFDPERAVAEDEEAREMSFPTETRVQKSSFIMLPMDSMSQLWGMLMMLCMLYEFCIGTFELVFLPAQEEWPSAFFRASDAITGLFFLDIVLSCNMGYIDRGVCVLNRGTILRSYFRSSFWFDLLALIPWHHVGCMLWTGRGASLLRLIRLAKAVPMWRSRWAPGAWLSTGSIVGASLQVLVVFLMAVHVHSCLYELARQQQEGMTTQDLTAAVAEYWEATQYSKMALVTGDSHSNLRPEGGLHLEHLVLLDLAAAIGHIAITAFIVVRVMWWALMWLPSLTRAEVDSIETLNYLNKHRVPKSTQMCILATLRQTAGVRNMQRHFHELMNRDLPNDLRRTVCMELWRVQLRTNGLVAHFGELSDNFIFELSQVVCEEVHGANNTLFFEGEASLTAYHIVRGELTVLRNLSPNPVPNFTEGMWVGESALVSSMLRRSARIGTVRMSSLMVLEGTDFHQVITRHGLMRYFEQFCVERLWRGLCGRCGSLGDHFTDRCPHAQQTFVVSRRLSQCQAKNGVQMLERKSSIVSRVLSTPTSLRNSTARRRRKRSQKSRDLRWFLQEQGLSLTEEDLQVIGVHNLEQLETLDVTTRQPGHGPLSQLSEKELKLLSPKAIHGFRERTASMAKASLQHHFTHSHHFCFLSHYKLEAGTEAALMRNELAQLIQEDAGNPAGRFEVPVFLDSENLYNLEDLLEKVRLSHNVLLLLTKNILLRPWVLLELVTAWRSGISVQLVYVQKGREDPKFTFPDEAFYERVRNNQHLDAASQEMLSTAGITPKELEEALRYVFKNIAVEYSPHSAQNIRQAQLKDVLKRCTWSEFGAVATGSGDRLWQGYPSLNSAMRSRTYV